MRRRISMLAGACVLSGVYWLASVAIADAQSAQGATLSSSTTSCVASAGCSMPLSGAGFAASETVDLTLHSTPSSLGTVSANQSGDFVTTVTIPAGFPTGTHSIVAIGETSGATATFTFVLTAAPTPTTAPPPTTTPTTTPSPTPTTAAPAAPSSPSSKSGLAFTGADISVISEVAAIAVALGALGLLSGRAGRRRRRSRVQG